MSRTCKTGIDTHMNSLKPYWGLVETHDGTYIIFRGDRKLLTGRSREFAEDYVNYRFDMEPGRVTLVTSDGHVRDITRRFRRRRWRWPWRRHPEPRKVYQETLES